MGSYWPFESSHVGDVSLDQNEALALKKAKLSEVKDKPPEENGLNLSH